MTNRILLATSFLAVTGCAISPQHVEKRAVSERAAVTSTQLADGEWQIAFESNLSLPHTEEDRFMPTGSPILAEAERLCPVAYSIVEMSDVDFEADAATQSLFARSTGIVLCLSEPPPCGDESM